MDPNEQRSRSPSLLDADVHETPSAASSERILSGLHGNAAPPVTNRPRRWAWLAVLALVCAAVLLLTLGGAFDGTGSTSAARVATHADVAPGASDDAASIEPGAMSETVAPGSTDPGSEGLADAAVILPDQPGSTVSTALAAPAPASTSKDAVALSEMFAPASERKPAVSAPRATRRARGTTTDDSDVALLTALIHHVEVGGPSSGKVLEHVRRARKPAGGADTIEARMQACPAANTEAGLRCRQRLCAGHSGESTACPESTGG